VNIKSSEGYTPLHIIATMDLVEGARMLLDNGADVQALAVYDLTPLHMAALYGQKEMIVL
jgi:ankyrin repeat protein